MKPGSLLLALFALAANPTFGQAPPSWKLGDSWQVNVDHFPTMKDKEPLAKSLHYKINVLILGPEKVDGIVCMKVDFLIPEPKPPAGLSTARFRVFVDPADGWPRKAFSFKDYRSLPMETFDKARMHFTAPEGFPIEILPKIEMPETKGALGYYHLTMTVNKETGLRTAIFKFGLNEIKIEQTWKDGEPWWHDYARYRNGHLELKATRIDKKLSEVAKVEPKEKPAPAPVKAEAPPPPKDQTASALARDERLQKRITLNLTNPKIDDILQPLNQAAGLTFTADDNVDGSKPVFGNCVWGNYPIHAAMQRLAESPEIQGRWVKTDDGYMLLGWPRPKRAPSRAWSNYIIGILAASNVFFAVVTVILWRRKRPQAE